MRNSEKITQDNHEQDDNNNSKGAWNALKNVMFRGRRRNHETQPQEQEPTYTEEPLTVPDFDGVSSIEIGSEDSSKFPENFDARTTMVTNSEGESKKSSDIFRGYPKEGQVELENGQYFNEAEAKAALVAYLEAQPDGVSYVGRSDQAAFEGKQARIDFANQIMLEVASGDTNLILSETDAVENQNAKDLDLESEGGERVDAGMLMLGKLESVGEGRYILDLRNKIADALNQYMMVTTSGTPEVVPDQPTEITDATEPTRPTRPHKPSETIDEVLEPEHQQVVERHKENRKLAIIISALFLIPLSMVLHSCSVNAQPTEPVAPTPIVQEDPTIPPQEARNQFPEDIFAPPVDASEQHETMQGGIAIGDVVHVNENTKYFESSDYDTGGADREGQFGRQLPPGDYRVEAFSALVGGEINQVERRPGETIDNLVARVAEDLGISQEEVIVRLHLTEVGDNEGEPVGWLDPSDVTPIEQSN